jgi:hypothetical protein
VRMTAVVRKRHFWSCPQVLQSGLAKRPFYFLTCLTNFNNSFSFVQNFFTLRQLLDIGWDVF